MSPANHPFTASALAAMITLAVPTSAAPTLEDARLLYRARELDQAQAIFEAHTSSAAARREAVYYLGKIAILRGRYDPAVQWLEQAVALAPERPDYFVWLGNGYAWMASAAPACEKLGLGRKCLAAYRRALELDPDNVSAHFALMNFYRHVPAFLGGGLGAAYHEAAAVRRHDARRGQLALAVLCAQEEKYAPAFAALEEILRQQPDDYASNSAFGRIAVLSQSRLSEGEARLRRCLEQCPGEDDEDHATVQKRLDQLVALHSEPAGPCRTHEAKLKPAPAPAPSEVSLARPGV